MGILQEIARKTRLRVIKDKKIVTLEEMKVRANAAKTPPSFEAALRKEGVAFICEVKKASPSKGVIVQDFDPLKIAQTYEMAGAQAISVLTEPSYFQGSNDYLKAISEAVDIPLLRKDFIIDEYMIYEAKALGASAVLLICSLLDHDTLTRYLNIAHSIGLDALVEVHTVEEALMALKTPARIIGVNHRNLSDFSMDLDLSAKIRPLIPKCCLFVAESGLHTSVDIEKMKAIGADAVLIGESLMREPQKLKELKAHG